jgi:spore coat polysaccharide biosynthesis protein SpsF (cytidylyltransferase family)/aryl-alcohol dehydrogenase-like predicted oxidoreductase
MRIIAVLQARTNSTRLPGKALLPVAGYASAVLAALRGSNRGNELLAATSADASDDMLTRAFHENGIHIFRGPLDDVLARFYLATTEFPSDSIVVRLTGDNLLPDGELVMEVAKQLADSRLEYLSVEWPQSRLPYGLCVEAFSIAALKKAHANATNPTDREHVGPWMARCCRSGVYSPHSKNDQHVHLRCTIDDQEDYERILRLFAGITEPVRVGWEDLVERLASLPGEPAFRVPYKVLGDRIHSGLTLGTAQLGMDYGLVNSVGKPSRQRAVEIVRYAFRHGVTAVDTAQSYGDAEEIVGDALSGTWRPRTQIVTKIDLSTLSSEANSSATGRFIENRIERSCASLGVTSLQTLLLHRWSDHDNCRGAAWAKLVEMRDAGRIAVLGASVYEPEEAFAALRDPDIQHLQIPVNILDRRWKSSGMARLLADRPEVVVHARSVFLQGILLHPAERWPHTSHREAETCVSELRRLTRTLGRENVADLCISYVRSLAWITSIVVGCETLPQLEENLHFFCLPKLSPEECELVEQAFPAVPDTLLNPAKWKLNHESATATR